MPSRKGARTTLPGARVSMVEIKRELGQELLVASSEEHAPSTNP